MSKSDRTVEVHNVKDEQLSDDEENEVGGSTGCLGCATIIIAIGVMIAIIKIASAIASGTIPPPW